MRASSRKRSTICWADDVVFYSPIVYAPPRGKPLRRRASERPPGRFPATQFLRRFSLHEAVLASDVAMVEVEATAGCKYVDGIDIIRCDEAGPIVELRVMIRPSHAIHGPQADARDARIDAAATAPDER